MSNAMDLVSLSQAEAWIGAAAANQTALVASLITDVSRQILTSLNRPAILPASYSETLDGTGQSRLILRNYPVLSVSTLIVDNVAVTQRTPPSTIGVTPSVSAVGYLLQPWAGAPPGRPQAIDLFGAAFSTGRQNVYVTYSAGYQISAEAQAAAASVTAAQPYGAWATDQGVVYAATGAALTKVSGAPAAGQYSVSAGVYAFAAADAGNGVLVSYGFVPYDLSRAAAMWVSDLISYQGRVGYQSKSVGGHETVSFILESIPTRVATMIRPYRNIGIFTR